MALSTLLFSQFGSLFLGNSTLIITLRIQVVLSHDARNFFEVIENGEA